ncbi:unnamed protein product [Pleuronectes platessa]|uniref:Uncharacterized protein n=1 Tax=Pleuronectes platessa TaxID=8262 RepID=A0A9N7VJQ2_PLEPL|nr:unnamed protein product [Pleuronectes platessa]
MGSRIKESPESTFEVYLEVAHPGSHSSGVECSSSNLKVGSSIPSLTYLHADLSLGKMLNPEWPPIE